MKISTNTTNSAYITTISGTLSATSIKVVNPPTRFVPMKRTVHTARATHRSNIALNTIKNIDDFASLDPSLYYVENGYTDESYGHSITLFTFKIVKETKCYYFLVTGQRIAKNLRGRTYALTPSGAMKKALARARAYLDILIHRGQSVSDFIKATDFLRHPGMRELRCFEEIARSYTDPDQIPHELLRENALLDPDSIGRFP